MNQTTFILKLFNSLTNKVDELELIPSHTVKLYLCGPTVYEHVHIGNLRSVIIFDVLQRLLLSLGYKVKYVHNLTDIDDKIIAKAQQENKTEFQVTQYYIRAYFQNLANYNILQPAFLPQVTDYIFPIQKFISNLLHQGQAYQQKNDVLFRVRDNSDYGRLSKQKLDKLKEPEARQDLRKVKINKENIQDFVLWKSTHQGKVWNSPWGLGRPGWHTECVVFIQELFQGQTIDIHGGGSDLLFPHHENERIQYLVHNNQELSKIWLHIGHLHWKQEKMSKSEKNVILAKDFYQKYGANVLRFLFLNAYHNKTINFDEKLVQQAENYIQKTKNLLKKLNFYLYIAGAETLMRQNSTKSTTIMNEMNVEQWTQIDFKTEAQNNNLSKQIIEGLLNNLNTIKVLCLLEHLIYLLNKTIDLNMNLGKGIFESSSFGENNNFTQNIKDFYFISDILGFRFDLSTYDLKTKLLIKEWQELRQAKRYLEADQIRKQLQKIDVI